MAAAFASRGGRARAPLSPFARRVMAAVRGIPRGRVATYGDIARAAGRPLAHRAVGNLMRELPDPSLPAHRVVGAGGALGGFGGSPHVKAGRLRAEGVTVINGRIRRFSEIRWAKRPAKTNRSLTSSV